MKITYTSEVLTTKLGKALREKRANMSLREAAEQSGIFYTTLHRIENGGAPDIQTFQAAMEWLGIKAAEWPKYIDWEIR